MKQLAADYFLLFGLLLSSTGLSLQKKTPEGLYNLSDDVFILHGSNFKRNIVDSDSVWIVEFYNSWCGHCIKFAPFWKTFATGLQGISLIHSVGSFLNLTFSTILFISLLPIYRK